MNNQILEYLTWDFIGSIIFVNFLCDVNRDVKVSKGRGEALKPSLPRSYINVGCKPPNLNSIYMKVYIFLILGA